MRIRLDAVTVSLFSPMVDVLSPERVAAFSSSVRDAPRGRPPRTLEGHRRGGFSGSHSSSVVPKMWAPSIGMSVRSSICAP